MVGGAVVVGGKQFSYSAVGSSLLVGAMAFQWGVLWHGWFAWETSGNPDGKIQLDTASLIHGLYCATTVLVAYGAVLGRTNTLQTLVFTFLGGFFYCLNYYITVGEIHGTDLGGALTIHLFGAFFGIGVSFIIGLNDLNDFTIPGEVPSPPLPISPLTPFFFLLSSSSVWSLTIPSSPQCTSTSAPDILLDDPYPSTI